jgi:hypothetical protein
MRRTSRPNNPGKKFDALSDVRRAQISDAITKKAVADEDSIASKTPAIAHSPKYRQDSLNKIGSIVSPMGQPSSSSQTDRMGPEVYSPLFQLANLNLPRDRVTMNAWNRIYYDTHPIVRNAINLHASFPISKINISCSSKKVQQFFEDMAERIDLYSVIYGAGLEFWKLGETFPYSELDKSNGTWSRISILNPDYVHVKKSIIGNQTIASLRPDASLQRLINSTAPSDVALRRYIPEHIIDNVRRGKNIPLDPFNVSHLKLLSSPYDIRGTSIIVSCYKDIMLYDKLRESKFAQADGMINPLTLVKLGGNDYRPSQSDIEAFRHILEEAQYDKDFKLVTHADVTIERNGAGSGVMDIGSDITHITDNLYAGLMVPKSLMDQEGACVPVKNTEILVEGKGFISFDMFQDGDKIATINPNNHELEYQSPTNKTDILFSGLMYSIKNDMNDFECTDFHDILLSRDGGCTFEKEKAISVFSDNDLLSGDTFSSKYRGNVRFLNFASEFNGEKKDFVLIPDKEQYSKVEFIRKVGITNFCKFLGYYLSEGHLVRRRDPKRNHNNPCAITITQQEGSKGFEAMSDLFSKFEYKSTINYENSNKRCWRVSNTKLSEYILSNFGERSEGKYIAEWVKKLDRVNLRTLIEAMCLGDGSVNKNSSSGSFKYFTVSGRMADDFQEICFKAGYSSKLKRVKRDETRKDIYHISVFKNEESKRGRNRKFKTLVRPSDVSVNYVEKERVFCFDVPNHIFVTRKDGKIGVHGNSYASSSVGLEVLRQRYDIFRNMMKKWLERKIFAPICEIQDFFEYKNGEKRLMVPQIDFNHMNLYDVGEYVNSITPFVSNKQVSLQTVYRSLGLSYEEEKRRLREEAVSEAIFAKEQQILSEMRLSELEKLDPNKSIPEPARTTSTEDDQGGGVPGVDMGGGQGGPDGSSPGGLLG